MKNIVHIYGASGSGTSTLGKYICDNTGYYFMDTDDYFWLPTNPPYNTKRCASERIRLMKEDIERHDNVVISGSLTDWGDELIPLFTLAIRIETETAIRLERIKAREQKNFGSRIDIGGDMYSAHINFLDWAAAYDEGGVDIRSKRKHDIWQKQLLCPFIVLDGSIPTEKNFEMIKDKLVSGAKVSR